MAWPSSPSAVGRALFLVLPLALHLTGAPPALAQSRQEPLEVGRSVAARYPTATAISYVPALTWSGSLRLAALEQDTTLAARTIDELRPYLSGELPVASEPYRLTNLAGANALFDAAVAGIPEGLELAQQAAELMMPDAPGGPVRFATGWTDDMYMATSLLGRVGAATGDERYAAVIGDLLFSAAERLQRPDGLFVHAADAPAAWGRGNGFAALGLLEALTYLPDEWVGYGRILDIYRRHMRAMAFHQADDGSWHQVVDVPTSYRELTVTAMMVTAMARGVRIGWLDAPTYQPIIDRAWAAVAARVASDGSLRDACTSTAAGTTLEYYLERPVVNGFDDRAGGLVLMAAMEMALLGRA